MKRKRTTAHIHTQCASFSASSFVCVYVCREKREMFPSQWSSHSMWHQAEKKKRRTAITEEKTSRDEGQIYKRSVK